jgi:putative NADH-flavin reductase
MKIVLFGASGTIGSRITREALARGHDVTAVVRDPTGVPAGGEHLGGERGDVTSAADVARVARGAEAIVSTVAPTAGQPLSMLTDAARALIAGARKAGVKRLLVVGGAGSLEAPEGGRVMDRAGFPDAWKPTAQAHADALQVYRTEAGGLDWTYISPANVIEPGVRTGRYRIGDEQLLVNDQGNSHISAEDFAVAVVDELERPAHVGRRFTVAD